MNKRIARVHAGRFKESSFFKVWLDEERIIHAMCGRLREDNSIAPRWVEFPPAYSWKSAKQWVKEHTDALRSLEEQMGKSVKLEELSVMQAPSSIEHGEGKPTVLKGVKILGLTSRNNRRYTETALRKAAPLYEGVKVNVDHPQQGKEERSFRDRIGTIRSVAFRANEGLFGDLHCNPKHPWTETLVGWAETDASAVGLSHNCIGSGKRKDGVFVVEAINRLFHVDVVADPGSTKGLFETESEEKGDTVEFEELTTAELLKKRPDLHEQLLKEGAAQGDTEAELKAANEKLLAENKTLTTKNDAADAKEKLQEHKEMCNKALKEAELPERVVTNTFKRLLYEAKDEAAVKELVEDRKKLAADSKPTSKQKQISESAGDVKDEKEFASRITG